MKYRRIKTKREYQERVKRVYPHCDLKIGYYVPFDQKWHSIVTIQGQSSYMRGSDIHRVSIGKWFQTIPREYARKLFPEDDLS